MSKPDQIKAELIAACDDLMMTLLPDGKQTGAEWRGHGPDGAVWAVVTRGAKTGHYLNTGSGEGGISLLGLVRDLVPTEPGVAPHVHAYRWARRFLDGGTTYQPRPVTARPRGPPPGETPNGHGLYIHAQKFHWATPAGLYLRGRGIDPAALPRPPRALHWRPDVFNAEQGRNIPAMLAAIVDPLDPSRYLGTHRTYLAKGACGWGKAPVAVPKKVMGQIAGGIIILARGISDKPWKDMPVGDTLILAEGIENCLSIAQDMPECRAAAYVSAGNLPSVCVPKAVRAIVLCRDRDGLNTVVREARASAIHAWEKRGIEVDIVEPPAGVHDINDFITTEGSSHYG